jgi:hypothetical protein
MISAHTETMDSDIINDGREIFVGGGLIILSQVSALTNIY